MRQWTLHSPGAFRTPEFLRMTQHAHAMLPAETHDYRARHEYVGTLRDFIASQVYPRLRPHYEASLVPSFVASRGSPPATSDQVRTLMERSPLYQGFSVLARGTQELLWDMVGEVVERQLPELVRTVAKLSTSVVPPRLAAQLDLPDYTRAVDIHVMPGGYHTEDELGSATASAVSKQFPGWKPGRILDLGCGVDLGAPMVRYGAARAAALGYTVQLSQQDATRTDFPNGSFNLIASTLLLHELPRKAILAVLKECHRLLRPGGVMLHHDLLRWPEDPFDSFMMSWTTRHNNEPYERASGTLDFPRECAAVGFPVDDVFVLAQPGLYLEEVYQVSGIRGARKP